MGTCVHNGDPVVVEIAVKTAACQACTVHPHEIGMKVQLTGLMGLVNCTTDNLDKKDQHDYVAGHTAVFSSLDGIGGCGIDLYQSVSSAMVLWSGPGVWTPNTQDTVCVDFYGSEPNLLLQSGPFH